MVMEVKSPRWRCWQRHYFANKGPSSQSYGFFSNHVWIWELDYKESWAPKNWCFWTVVLEKTLESPLDCKEIQPVRPKGNQSWIFIVEAEAPVLWPADAKSWVIWKDNGLLLSHYKECIWVSSNEVDETGAYYTEWSKSERKTPI